MNSPQQIEAVKAIIRIKNKILHTTNWDEIVALLQNAIDTSVPVPACEALDTLDRTKSKEWNIMAVKNLIKSINDREFSIPEATHPLLAASLVRLSMVFVKNGIEDVNKILKDSFLRSGLFQTSKSKVAQGRS